MHHHRPSLFWPIILIGVGIIFLLNNAGLIQGNPWSLIWQLWPVLLIVIGLDILFGRRSAAGSIVGAVLALLVVGGVIWLLVARPNLPGLSLSADLTHEFIEHPLGDIRSADVSIDFATGDNRLYALGDSSQLIEGDIRHYGDLDFVASQTGDRGDVRLGVKGSVSIFGFQAAERWDVGLNTRPTYDLDVHLGAGQASVDLSRFKLSSARIEVGAGTADVSLPSTGRFTLRVSGGVGTLRIRAPRDVALRAEVNTGLGTFNAASRLQSIGDDIYQTEDFTSADNAITLILDIGVGTVSIQDQ